MLNNTNTSKCHPKLRRIFGPIYMCQMIKENDPFHAHNLCRISDVFVLLWQ